MTVFFTKGLPASGKSTWAKAWAQEKPNRVRISMNDLRRMLVGSGCESLVIAASLNLLENSLRLGLDVVVDNTNLNQQYVRQLTDVCERYNARIVWKTFYTSVEECIRRDSQRENPVGAEIITTMFEKHKKELTLPR